MAEAVAGMLASAFVRILKDKLRSAIAEQVNLLWNFEDDLGDMMNVLETISAALEDAERRSVKENLVQLLLKRLKDVAFDISDMLEDYQDTSDQTTAKNLGVLSCLPIAYKKTAMANRMKSTREKLSRISMEFEKFKFITHDTSTGIVQHYDKRETTSSFLPDVKGREGEKQEIINLISASTNNDQSNTMIVSIYGLGGTGKTTLAQLVYNDHQFKKYDHRIWVYVSQEFNLCKVGSTIISQLQIESGPKNGDPGCKNLHEIKLYLDNLLHGKKVLIVLDDLWEDDHNELMKLKSMLQVDKKGSMIDIIVTTREEGIAKNISTNEPYNLQPLNDDICWEIIKKYSNCNQREFQLIGLEIAKKCGGVPLAAQALGCMLQSKDISEWQKINNSDIWNETSKDSVLPSLKLSCQRMPQQLKICFSYCAIFSKGHNIVQDDLIHQWSALGFIETAKGKEYIKQLLGMSFLQVSKLPSTSQNHVVRYTMHDLVHDLARLTMADELVVFDVATWRNARAHKYCYYSLLKNYDRTMKLANILPPKMRAVRFSGSDKLDIQSGAFSFAKCLRTLDFSECSGILLPASIGQLKQLRCLIAPRMKNERLPKCITKLSKLQYLNINGSSKITELPESIGNLGCLEYLCLSSCSSISKLPESFGDLKCMVHLDMSDCSGLKKLPDSLGSLTHLQHLELSGCSRVKAIHKSLCCLTYLVSIQLGDIPKCTKLPPLGQLPHLENLWFWKLLGIKRIDREFCGGKGAFPRLLSFHVKYMPNLEEWNTTYSVEDGVEEFMFPVLDSLEIQQCPRLRLKPCPPTFRECLIHCCDQVISSLEVIEKTSHHCSSSSRALKLDLAVSIPYWGSIRLFHHFPALRELRITGASVTTMPESIRQLTSLESLTLSWCRGMSALPVWLGDLSSLKSLDISACFGIESLPACIQQLTKLQKLSFSLYNQKLKEWCESEENKAKLAHINVQFLG